MSYKIVFLDIDGTLLSHKTHSIPKSTIKALSEARKNGILLAINSGRCYYYAKESGVLDLFDFDYFVLTNGAVVTNKNNEIIIENTFDNKVVHTVIDAVEKNHLNINIVTSKDCFVINDRINLAHDSLDPLSISVPRVKKYEDEPVNMMTLFSSNFTDEEVKEMLKPVMNDLYLIRYNSCGMDLVKIGLNKAKGIELLASKLNIALSEVIAIGDGPNDIEMIETAGMGVAMGNATSDIKLKANYITTDIDDDGIYNAFKHLGLI